MPLHSENSQRTFRLFSQIQNYEWGNRNQQAFIPKLLGMPIQPGAPYAELWVGAHPKAPSTIVPHGKRGVKLPNAMTLDKFIEEDPELILGTHAAAKHQGLPFLFKILSIGDVLSIQAHPNKEQAKFLHSKDSQNFPDSNHKPEIAVCIDNFRALIGFQPFVDIIQILENYPEILEVLEPEAYAGLQECARIYHEGELRDLEQEQSAFRHFIEHLCSKAQEDSFFLARSTGKLQLRLESESLTRKLSDKEQLFLYLKMRYSGEDVGLLLLFMMNYVELEPGEAICIEPGTLHAYLHGNIVECMATSDNVVRAGFTPKRKDVNTLVSILDCSMQEPEIFSSLPNAAQIDFPVFCEDFQLSQVNLWPGNRWELHNEDKAHIIFLLKGKIILEYEIDGQVIQEDYQKSHCIFIPAGLNKLSIFAKENSTLFHAR